MSSPPIFEITFSYDKDIWIIVATDYYMHIYIIVLFPLTVILQLITITACFNILSLHTFSFLDVSKMLRNAISEPRFFYSSV